MAPWFESRGINMDHMSLFCPDWIHIISLHGHGGSIPRGPNWDVNFYFSFRPIHRSCRAHVKYGTSFFFCRHSGCGTFCVIFHIWETLINMGPRQSFSIGDTQWFWVLCVRSGCICPRSGSVWSFIYGKPLLTRGPGSCFPLVLRSGFGCCVYVVVLSAHEVVLCNSSYMGNPY